MAEVEAAPVIEQAASDIAQAEKMESEVKKEEKDDCNYTLADIDETAKVTLICGCDSLYSWLKFIFV